MEYVEPGPPNSTSLAASSPDPASRNCNQTSYRLDVRRPTSGFLRGLLRRSSGRRSPPAACARPAATAAPPATPPVPARTVTRRSCTAQPSRVARSVYVPGATPSNWNPPVVSRHGSWAGASAPCRHQRDPRLAPPGCPPRPSPVPAPAPPAPRADAAPASPATPSSSAIPSSAVRRPRSRASVSLLRSGVLLVSAIEPMRLRIGSRKTARAPYARPPDAAAPASASIPPQSPARSHVARRRTRRRLLHLVADVRDGHLGQHPLHGLVRRGRTPPAAPRGCCCRCRSCGRGPRARRRALPSLRPPGTRPAW